MLSAGCAAATALAAKTGNLVVDEMLLSAEAARMWSDALAGLEVVFVAVHCPLATLEERERRRRNENGLARGHLATVHEHHIGYDLEIDTSTASPTELAVTVLTQAHS